MGSMVSSGCAKCAMVDMVSGQVMLFETWTFDSDGMWQSNSNCVFVALVMTTVVISVLKVVHGCQEIHSNLLHSIGNRNTGKQQANDRAKKPEVSTREAVNSSSQQQL